MAACLLKLAGLCHMGMWRSSPQVVNIYVWGAYIIRTGLERKYLIWPHAFAKISQASSSVTSNTFLIQQHLQHVFTKQVAFHICASAYFPSLLLNSPLDSVWPAVTAHWASIPKGRAHADPSCTRPKCERCEGAKVPGATRRQAQRCLTYCVMSEGVALHTALGTQVIVNKLPFTWATQLCKQRAWISHMWNRVGGGGYVSYDSPGIKNDRETLVLGCQIRTALQLRVYLPPTMPKSYLQIPPLIPHSIPTYNLLVY